MQFRPGYDGQTVPIVDPGRYLEFPVNCSSDSRSPTNSIAWVKMCLATKINRSSESADFSNVIPVVAVGDMVSVANHSAYTLIQHTASASLLQRSAIGTINTLDPEESNMSAWVSNLFLI